MKTRICLNDIYIILKTAERKQRDGEKEKTSHHHQDDDDHQSQDM